MVSFHTPLSPTRRKTTPHDQQENLLKKRKRDDDYHHEAVDHHRQQVFKPKPTKFSFDHTELHLQTPLPLEWQRCLDIKSGQIYYYNTKTNKKTWSEPRLISTPEPTAPADHMSLDLELNLPCGSLTKNEKFPKDDSSKNGMIRSNINGGFRRSSSPSWLNFEGEQQAEHEMITAVCKNCHLLVMMCKSSPACPNCKFMHPPEQSTASDLFSRRLSLSC